MRRELNIVGIVGLFVGICGTGVAIWGVNEGKKIAESARQYQQGDLALGIGDERATDSTLNLFYRIPHSCGTELIVELPITILNQGESPITSAEVSLGLQKIDGASGLLGQGTENLMSMQGQIRRDITRTFSENEKWTYVYYDINNLPPTVSVTFAEPIPLISGTVNDTATFSDGIELPFSVEFSISYSLVVTWNNSKVDSYTLKVSRIDADDKNEALQKLSAAMSMTHEKAFLLESNVTDCTRNSPTFLKVSNVDGYRIPN